MGDAIPANEFSRHFWRHAFLGTRRCPVGCEKLSGPSAFGALEAGSGFLHGRILTIKNPLPGITLDAILVLA
jgi:hypothetical protein